MDRQLTARARSRREREQVTDEEARIDVEGRQAKLAQILSEGADAAGMGLLSLPPKPTRKPRSDKGVPKNKPAAAPTAQVAFSVADLTSQLESLIQLRVSAEAKLIAARGSVDAMVDVCTEYDMQIADRLEKLKA